jgi:hypothetical protein
MTPVDAEGETHQDIVIWMQLDDFGKPATVSTPPSAETTEG